MTRKVREIQDLVIDEISLVDKGANQHATVTIAKSADGEKENYMDIYDEQGNPLDPDALDIGDVVFDADGDAYEIQADNDDDDDELDEYEYEDEGELQEVGKASFQSTAIRAGMTARAAGGRASSKVAGARRARSQKHVASATQARGGLYGPMTQRQSTAADALHAFTRPGAGAQMAAIRGGERAGRAAGAAVNSIKAAPGKATSWAQNNRRNIGYGAAGVTAAGAAGYGGSALHRKVRKSYGAEYLREELSKALTDRDRDEVISKAFGQIEELSKAAEAAQMAAEEERDIRLTAEYIEIAKSYELPTVEVDELAQALKNMAENLSYEDCEVIGKALQFAAEAQDALYQEVGAIGGGDNSDVLQMVNGYVDGYVGKSNGFSREELTAEVFAANPEAYDQYLAEQRG